MLEYHSDDLSSLKRPDLGHFQLIFNTYFLLFFAVPLELTSAEFQEIRPDTKS